jgi:hypothetical protein
MMTTPHMVAGAAIGHVLRRPWLAYPAALASHFVLDAIPHLDSHSLFGANQGGPTRLEAAAGITDFLMGVVLVAWLTSRRPDRHVMRCAALLGVLMDLAEYVPPWGPRLQTWSGAACLVGFHHGIQHNLTPAHWALGGGTQLAVLALGIVVCLARGQSRQSVAGRQTIAL